MITSLGVLGAISIIVGLFGILDGMAGSDSFAIIAGLSAIVSGILFLSVRKIIQTLIETRDAVIAGFKLNLADITEREDEEPTEKVAKAIEQWNSTNGMKDSAISDYVASLNPKPKTKGTWWVPILSIILLFGIIVAFVFLGKLLEF